MYLLDTNVVSELGRRGRPDSRVVRWAAAKPVSAFYLSAISLVEIEVGVLLMERRDRRQGAVLREWFDRDVRRRFAGRILTVDETVAHRCASLHAPDPRPAHDALIAATAIVHGLTVVTRNIADFAPTGVPLINPWEPAAI